MTEPPEHASEEPANQPAADRAAILRHDVSNSLYSIWLQVRCAEASIEDAQLEDVKDNLGRIETAVERTQTVVDELAAMARSAP